MYYHFIEVCIYVHVFFSFIQLVDTTVEIANKVGGAEIVSRLVEDLKDENEQYRKMVMDCVEKVRKRSSRLLGFQSTINANYFTIKRLFIGSKGIAYLL